MSKYTIVYVNCSTVNIECLLLRDHLQSTKLSFLGNERSQHDHGEASSPQQSDRMGSHVSEGSLSAIFRFDYYCRNLHAIAGSKFFRLRKKGLSQQILLHV